LPPPLTSWVGLGFAYESKLRGRWERDDGWEKTKKRNMRERWCI